MKKSPLASRIIPVAVVATITCFFGSTPSAWATPSGGTLAPTSPSFVIDQQSPAFTLSFNSGPVSGSGYSIDNLGFGFADSSAGTSIPWDIIGTCPNGSGSASTTLADCGITSITPSIGGNTAWSTYQDAGKIFVLGDEAINWPNTETITVSFAPGTFIPRGSNQNQNLILEVIDSSTGPSSSTTPVSVTTAQTNDELANTGVSESGVHNLFIFFAFGLAITALGIGIHRRSVKTQTP
jgi:hypothetical protein